MLALTHDQPAVPVTIGKEMAIICPAKDAKRDYLNIMDQLATDHFPYHEYEQTYYTQFQGPLK